MDETGDGLFCEQQRFRQPWLWALLLVVTLGSGSLFGYGIFVQIVHHQPFGNHPASDTALLWVGGLVIAMDVALLWLLWRMNLIVQTEPDALSIRFAPLVRRRIPYQQIASAEARTYNPLLEYGGWGIRYGRSGKAYNMSGNRGLQLTLRSGERLLIGSQRADALETAIRAKIGGV